MAKVPLPKLKRGNIDRKTFDSVFISYAQNSVACRFRSLNDFTNHESRDAKFFDHVLPLKKDVSTIVPTHDNVNMPASSYIVRDSIDEPRRSKRRRVWTSFGPNFLNTFLVEDFDVNLLTDELLSAFFIQ